MASGPFARCCDLRVKLGVQKGSKHPFMIPIIFTEAGVTVVFKSGHHISNAQYLMLDGGLITSTTSTPRYSNWPADLPEPGRRIVRVKPGYDAESRRKGSRRSQGNLQRNGATFALAVVPGAVYEHSNLGLIEIMSGSSTQAGKARYPSWWMQVDTQCLREDFYAQWFTGVTSAFSVPYSDGVVQGVPTLLRVVVESMTMKYLRSE
ncbi:hypothetical protein BJ742DRAFT_53754 [Cladochytrium replicatum]|nr:hypothetical protein BJ742DRAFT_53754 [Cladochytrium replicatum]